MLTPLNSPDWGAVCPSVFQQMTGGTTILQGLNEAATHQCSPYVSNMMSAAGVSFAVAAAALIALLGRKRPILGAAPTIMEPKAPFPPPSQPAAGWYVAPDNRDLLRWWDGGRWTDDSKPRN